MAHDRDEVGRFLPGNRFWEKRSSAGPKPKFKDAEQLWTACREYFEWNADNPLYEDRLVTFQGKATHEPVAKMRAMTITSLCLFLDICLDTWFEWKKSRADLSEVITRAESIIRSQKFEGAAADLLNPNIIARDLGLADTTKLAGHGGGAIPVEVTMTPKELARRFAFIMASAAEQAKQQDQDVEREAS